MLLFGRYPSGQPVPIFYREAFRYIFFAKKKAKKDAASNKRSDSRNTFENKLWN